MTQGFGARAASTVSRAALGLALGTLGFAAAFAQETAKSDSSELKLPELVVGASRQELEESLSPGVVSVVYPDDVKGEHKSLPDLLDQIPGVYVRRVSGTGHYTTASIRGSAPSQVNIYIDGVPFNLASETAADLSTIPISNVERVEVYRGTTPARFSGAPLGGAINIVTKKPDGIGGSISGGMRSYEGRQASVSLNVPVLDGTLLVGINTDRAKGNFKYDNFAVSQLNGIVNHDGTSPLTGGAPTTDGNADLTQVERTRMNNRTQKDDMLWKWQNDNFFAKWAYVYMDRDMPNPIRPYAGYIGQTTDLPDAQPGYNPWNRQKQSQHDGVLGWNDSFGDLTLGLNVSAMDQHKWYRTTSTTSPSIGRQWSEYQTRRYGSAADASYQLGHDWAIDQVLEIHGDVYRETLHADMNGRTASSAFIDKFRRYKTDIQVQDTITFNFLDGLQITPVGRLERLAGPAIGTGAWGSPAGGTGSDYGWKPTGSISAKKNFGEGWQAFGSYGTFNRYPNFYEIYGDGIYVVPNSDSTGNTIPLKREFGWNSDVGIGWNGDLGYTLFDNDLKGGFRATYFERKTHDAITYYAVPLASKYVNSGDTYQHGVEFEGNLSWGKRADLSFALTRQEGWYQNGGWFYYGGTAAGQRYPGGVPTINAPLVNADIRLDLHFLKGDLTTYFELKHTGKMFTDVKTYEGNLTTFDTGAHYKVADGVKFSFGITDLFNQGPKQKIYYPSNSSSNYHYTTTTCPISSDPFDCLFNDPVIPLVDETTYRGIAHNVSYPQQGRTLYATLAWTF